MGKHNCKLHYPPQRGFSLLELMLAMSLGLLLTLSSLTLVSQFKHALTSQMALLSLAKRSRLLVTLFQHRLMMAGSMGCRRLPILNHSQVPFLSNPNELLQLKANTIEYHHLPLPADSVRLQYMANPLAYLITQESAKQIIVNDSPTFKKGDIIIISDCYHAEVLQVIKRVKVKGNQSLTLNHALVFHYSLGTVVGHEYLETWYLAKDRLSQSGFSLYSKQWGKRAVARLSNIVALAIKVYHQGQFIKIENSQFQAYHLQRLSVSVLLSSAKNSLAKAPWFSFNGKTWRAPDRKYYFKVPLNFSLWQV